MYMYVPNMYMYVHVVGANTYMYNVVGINMCMYM